MHMPPLLRSYEPVLFFYWKREMRSGEKSSHVPEFGRALDTGSEVAKTALDR